MIREYALKRTVFTKASTIGELTLDGKHVCYILEDTVRAKGAKVMHETAIPYGRYQLVITLSPRLGKETPRLLDVPGFDGILVHAGNSAADSSGCLLPGTSKSKNWVSGSKVAVAKFHKQLEAFLDAGDECWLTITQ